MKINRLQAPKKQTQYKPNQTQPVVSLSNLFQTKCTLCEENSLSLHVLGEVKNECDGWLAVWLCFCVDALAAMFMQRLLQTAEQVVFDDRFPAHIFCKLVAGLNHTFNFGFAFC